MDTSYPIVMYKGDIHAPQVLWTYIIVLNNLERELLTKARFTVHKRKTERLQSTRKEYLNK